MNRKSLKEFLSKCYGYTFRDDETVMKYYDELYEKYAKLDLDNKRLTELLIYALLPKKIYDHELDMNTMNKFIEIVTNNLQYDTHTIREKLVDCWNNIGKDKNKRSIFEVIDEENK